MFDIDDYMYTDALSAYCSQNPRIGTNYSPEDIGHLIQERWENYMEYIEYVDYEDVLVGSGYEGRESGNGYITLIPNAKLTL